MDLIDAFKRLGIDLGRHATPLARVGFRKGFGSPASYLAYLKKLVEEADLMKRLAEKLRGEVEVLLKEPRTEFTSSQLRMLKRSIDSFSAEYDRKHGAHLEGELKVLIAESRG